MFEHFGETARDVLLTAQEEARLLRHNRLGTEHLLLGVLRAPDSVGARALTNLGVTMQGTRAHVRRIVGEGQTEVRGKFHSRPEPSGCSSTRRAKRSRLGTTTLSASTLCSDWCGNPRGWPAASCWTSTSTVRRFAAGCADCWPYRGDRRS